MAQPIGNAKPPATSQWSPMGDNATPGSPASTTPATSVERAIQEALPPVRHGSRAATLAPATAATSGRTPASDVSCDVIQANTATTMATPATSARR